jgi:excisionase family DNA binding protein
MLTAEVSNMVELWDLWEVSKRTKTSVALWRKLIAQGKVPVVRIGRCVRLNPEHVSAWLTAHTQRPKGDSR